MFIVVDVKQNLYADVEGLLPGRYESFDQFVEVALRNQIALERRASSQPFVEVASLAQSPVRAAETEPAVVAEPVADEAMLVRKLPPDAGIEPLKLDYSHDSEVVLWGQVNRFLPMVAGVRVLANLIVRHGQSTVAVQDWHDGAARVAQQWGPRLAQLDQASGRKRGELWATAFPTEDRTSARRYVSQFLASPSGAPGAAVLLGLVGIVGGDRDSRVGLTSAGIQLVSLENPVFDTSTPRSTFSVAEARFLLELLERVLPGEHRLMRLVAELIDHGADRAQLNREIAQRFPRWESFVSTMRAGVIGRLHDLGLLHRIRKGQQVEYALTELAYDLDLVRR